MPRTLLPLVLALALGACGATPGACRNRALAELRALDTEIAATERALADGYRAAPGGAVRAGIGICAGNSPVTLCLSGQRQVSPGTRAIDPAAERARLAALGDRRPAVAAAAEQALAGCTPP